MKLIELVSRACPWLSSLRSPHSIIAKDNDTFDKARAAALKRPSVLKTQRERLLAKMIAREIRRYHTFLPRKEQTALTSNGCMLSDFYLRSGYLYFSDFGISPESQFYFLELGQITRKLYAELKAVPTRLTYMMFEGDDRKEEFQRHQYDTRRMEWRHHALNIP